MSALPASKAPRCGLTQQTPARESRTGVRAGQAARSSRAAKASGLFFERHRHVGVGRKADLAVLDIRNQPERDEVMMPFMAALALDDLGARVRLGQLDAVAFDLVDGADMDAVRTDDLHVPGSGLHRPWSFSCVEYGC